MTIGKPIWYTSVLGDTTSFFILNVQHVARPWCLLLQHCNVTLDLVWECCVVALQGLHHGVNLQHWQTAVLCVSCYWCDLQGRWKGMTPVLSCATDKSEYFLGTSLVLLHWSFSLCTPFDSFKYLGLFRCFSGWLKRRSTSFDPPAKCGRMCCLWGSCPSLPWSWGVSETCHQLGQQLVPIK